MDRTQKVNAQALQGPVADTEVLTLQDFMLAAVAGGIADTIPV